MSNIGAHVKASIKDTYAPRAEGVPPSVLVGTVKDETFWGDSSLIVLDIDNTTTSVTLDYDEWEWEKL